MLHIFRNDLIAYKIVLTNYLYLLYFSFFFYFRIIQEKIRHVYLSNLIFIIKEIYHLPRNSGKSRRAHPHMKSPFPPSHDVSRRSEIDCRISRVQISSTSNTHEGKMMMFRGRILRSLVPRRCVSFGRSILVDESGG